MMEVTSAAAVGQTEAWWMVDQLVQQGVTKFCIAPGSRSTPLVLAAAEHPGAKTMVHFDERGIAFYALGIGKSANLPAAVIATSGTACANLLPAVMEAYHSATPLLLLTADRPHELRECGANQTTDQVKLFSNVVRWQMDLTPNLPENAIRSIAAQSVFYARQCPQGPVQINCPFREPFYTPNFSGRQGNAIPLLFPELVAKPIKINACRGVILLGKTSDPAPVLALAKRLHWPLFADILSNARCTPTDEQIRHFDALIQSPLSLQPDFILHFGDRFTSKHILEWAKDAPLLHVSPHPALQDPARRLSSRVQSDIGPFCASFEATPNLEWLKEWQMLDREIATLIDEQFQSFPFSEAHIFRSLPEDRPFYLGSGMPIRFADRFLFPKTGKGFFANRGVSGIDGNIATAAGVSDGLQSPLIAFIGDQAALHDLNSLSLLKKRPVLLVIVNNFGGGIFDYLLISQSSHLDRYFTASHELHFEAAALAFDLPYVRFERCIGDFPASGIVELVTDRRENVQFLGELKAACSRVLV